MENLVKKAKAGDSGAFAQLIRMNTQSMYKVAWAYLKNDEDVADAIQETILKCYEKLSTLKKDSYFKTWMIRILINNWLCRLWVEGNPGIPGREVPGGDAFVLQQIP